MTHHCVITEFLFESCMQHSDLYQNAPCLKKYKYIFPNIALQFAVAVSVNFGAQVTFAF